jgi:hypothetical protein
VEVFLVVLIGAAAAAFVTVRGRRRDGRDRGIAALAESLHLTYSPIDLFGDGWQPFHFFGLGTDRDVENVLAGTVDGVEMHAFDYEYADEGSGSLEVARERRRFSCAVFAVAASCPKLTVQPRSMTDDLIGLVGADVLPLELEAFNRRFRVRCEDQRFAVAFLEQRMMEALLRVPLEVAIGVSDDRILVVARQLPVEQLGLFLTGAATIHGAFPRSLPSQYPLRSGSTGTLETRSATETAELFERLVDERERERHPADGGLYPW